MPFKHIFYWGVRRMTLISFERLNKIAHSLNIEVIEDSKNPGLFYKDEDGNLIEFDVRDVLDVFYYYNKENKL